MPVPFDQIGIGGRIKRLRQAQGLTLQDLAKKAHISPGYLSEVERGRSAISVGKMSQIADGLRMTVDALLGEEPETLDQTIVQIPAALSAAADQLNLSHRATLMLLQGQRSLTARRSGNNHAEWGVDQWIKFYDQVRGYLPEC